MTRIVRVLEEAAEEAIEAAAWYGLQRHGLEAEFARAVDAARHLLDEEIVPLVAMHASAGNQSI